MWSSSHLTALLVALSALTLVADSALLQSCESAMNCVFEVRGVSDRVYLDCNETEKLCTCSQFPYIADVPAWELTSGPAGECRIAETGPCGRDRNMVLDCAAGSECIEGRCRKREKVGTAKEGEFCEESLDCRSGLKCSVTGFYFQPTRRCTNMTFVDNYGPEVHQASSEEQQQQEPTTSKPHHHHHHHQHKHEHRNPEEEQVVPAVPAGKVAPNSMEQRQHESDERSTTRGSSSSTEAPLVAPTAKATGANGNGAGDSSLRGGCRLMALVSAVAVVVLGSHCSS